VAAFVFGGVEEDRTPDLRIANAALSQLSYHPEKSADSTRSAGTRQIAGSGGYNRSKHGPEIILDINPPYGYQEIVPLAKTHKVLLPAERRLPVLFRNLTALPLSFVEFAPAVHDYPIAFISGDSGSTFVAMAILGLEARQNLFVTGDDRWDAGVYLPAYVRRYPFCMTRVTVDGQEQTERIACVEKRAINAKGEALYDDNGEPLPAWDHLRKLLFEFEADLARTEELCRKLNELRLLETFTAQVAPQGEAPIALTGMYRVSEEKLNALPAGTLQELARNGMLSRVYAHLLSLDNFQRLLDRRSRLRTREKPARRVDPNKLN
jgi:hypothetical protein